MVAHRSGKGSKYVRSRLPFAVEWSSPYASKRIAMKLEARLKRMSRQAKEALIRTGPGCRYEAPTGNPLLRSFRQFQGGSDEIRPHRALDSDPDFQDFCQELHRRYSWGIPDEEALDIIASNGPLVEMGAGLGYWASLLRAKGADVVAMDGNVPGASMINPWHPGRVYFTPVQPGRPEDLSRYSRRTLFLCWPPMKALDESASMAIGCLNHWSGKKLILVGDPDFVAGSEFHDRLSSEFFLRLLKPLPSLPPAAADSLTIWERRT